MTMIKIFLISLFIANILAATLYIDDIVGGPEEEQINENENSDDGKMVLADEPIPKKVALASNQLEGEMVALVIPQNVFRIDLFYNDENNTNETNDSDMSERDKSEYMAVKVVEENDFKLNNSYLTKDPEFKVNHILEEAEIRPIKITKPTPHTTIPTPTPTPTPTTTPITISDTVVIIENTTVIEKSFLEKIEEELGISGSPIQLNLHIITVIMSLILPLILI